MTRRKSRPLLLHESISDQYLDHGYSNIAPSSSLTTAESIQQRSSSSQSSIASSQTTANGLPDTCEVTKEVNEKVESTVAVQEKPLISESTSKTKIAQENGERAAKPIEGSCSPNGNIGKAQDHSAALIRSLSQTLPTKRRPGYLANRRNASFMIHDDASAAQSSGISLSQNPEGPSQGLKRTPSLVRLSLSLDGKAEVTTRTGDTPSPPRSQPTPSDSAMPRSRNSIQRSYSAIESNKQPEPESVTVPFPRRPMTGRSRDSRTWEFYCDSDARNALTEQAEREESGSATAAISLIRSCSRNKKVMASNPNKRNAHTQKPEVTKRLKAESQKSSKPKLARAVSSIARLQTSNENVQRSKNDAISHKKSNSGSYTDLFRDGDGDSDKENWEPGTQTSNVRRRKPANLQQVSRILEESLRVPSQSTSLDALMHRSHVTASSSSRKSSSSEEKENSGPESEIAAFMGESVPREVEDLDCVQNLLSLSQASWR